MNFREMMLALSEGQRITRNSMAFNYGKIYLYRDNSIIKNSENQTPTDLTYWAKYDSDWEYYVDTVDLKMVKAGQKFRMFHDSNKIICMKVTDDRRICAYVIMSEGVVKSGLLDTKVVLIND